MRFNDCGKSQKFFKIVLLLLAAVMLSSVFMMTACQKPDSEPEDTPSASDTSTTTTSPSLDLIKNGNFEDTYETQYPRVPRYWTSLADSYNGKNASRTDSESGVISTDEEDFETVIKNMFGRVPDPDSEDDKELREKVAAIFGSWVLDEANPGMHEDIVVPDDDDSGEEDTLKNVIMLHNAVTNPTAIKYKSQSLSIPANSYARISMYVKTVGLQGVAGAPEDEYGATIAFSESSTSIISLTGIKNTVWQRYDFYLESSYSSAKTVYIEVGLGHGATGFTEGYTTGTVFFDEIKLEYINKAEYEKEVYADGEVGQVVYREDDLRADGSNRHAYYTKKLNVSNMSETAFAMTYAERSRITTDSLAELYDSNKTAADANSPFFINSVEPAGQSNQINKDSYQGKVFAQSTPVTAANEEDQKFGDALANYPFSGSKVFYMENQVPGINGVQAFSKTIAPFASDDLVTGEKLYSHYRLSLYVKTSDFIANGLNIIMEYSETGSGVYKYQTFTSINTTTSDLTAEDLEKDANIHNKWDNWVEYSFYFEANPFVDTDVNLYLWLGPENISGKQVYDLTKGWAMFSDASISLLTSEEYSAAPSSSTVKSGIKMYSTTSPQIENSNFNSFSSGENSSDIKVIPLAPSGWSGFYGGDKRIVGDNEANNNVSSNVVKGIIDTRYIETAGFNKSFIPAGLTASMLNGTGSITPSQPRHLMIYNKSASAYGYQTAAKTLAANSVYVISVRVMTMGGANAYIYLTDSDGNVFEQPDEADDGSALKGVTYSYEKVTQSTWTEYTFYVKTGDFSKSVKLELWNGDRFGNVTSAGAVFFDDAYMGTIDSKAYDELKEDFDEDDTTIKWGDFTDIDIEASESPTTPVSPSPSTPATEPEDYVFPWGLLTSLLIVVALMVALVSIAVRRFKTSKIMRAPKIISVKKQKRTYDRKVLGKYLTEAERRKAGLKAKDDDFIDDEDMPEDIFDEDDFDEIDIISEEIDIISEGEDIDTGSEEGNDDTDQK